MSRFSALLLLLLASLATCSTDECFLERDEAECCREVLLPGQYPNAVLKQLLLA